MPIAELVGFYQKRPASAASGYTIARSLRFNSADSAALTRTPGGAGNRTTSTLSLWTKRSALGSTQALFGCGTSASDTDYLSLAFNSSDKIIVSGGVTTFRTSTAVYRDPSAWYHIVVAIDTSNGTAASRIKVYVNGSEVTAFDTTNNPSSSANTGWSQAAQHMIGARGSLADYYNGYIAEVHFVDGTALTPSTFGETSATTGQWIPKQITGVTYGTNGFWLSFYDNTSTTTLGRDDAGGAAGSAAGSNDWTLNNFSVTAGVGNDSFTDTPTNNYCVLHKLGVTTVTLANGGLEATTGNAYAHVRGTFGMTSGKWYWEVTPTTDASVVACPGIVQEAEVYTNDTGRGALGWGYYANTGQKFTNSSLSSYGTAYAVNDVVGVAFDADNGKLYFSKNGTWQNSGDPAAGTNAAFTGLTSGPYYPSVSDASSGASSVMHANFGQRAFAATPPTGFKALCAQNLPDPTITKPNGYFDATVYTGNGSSLSVTNAGGFQPDFVWVKNRATTTSHVLQDSTRGAGLTVFTNSTAAEGGTSGDLITSFNSNGFTVNDTYAGGSGGGGTSGSGQSHVAWQWKEGVTSGLDIVAYAGDASASGTRNIAHSLGVTPAMIIIKRRSGGTGNWIVQHKSVAAVAANASTFSPSSNTVVYLNLTNASGSYTHDSGVNGSGNNYVAYLFAEVAGFSRFGSYTGNASTDGPFVNCGFRPRFVMVKRTDSTENWQIYDAARDTYNAAGLQILPNSSSAEADGRPILDAVSIGFKLRTVSGGGNASGGTYIYGAFAEAPFKYANAR